MAQDEKYYEQSVDSLALSQQDFFVKSYNKTQTKSFLHKLGNSLGLVVVTLPLAGLFAAVGGIIMSKGTSEGVYTLGLVLADLGQTVLSNLGLLFMLAIIMGFTGNKGMALYAGVIGYIAFVGFSMPFIRYDGGVSTSLKDPETFSIWFWKGLEVNTQLANIFGLGQGAIALGQGEIGTHGEFARLSYAGIKTLNTGVLGGIALGFIYSVVYNKFKDLKLPAMLAFFEGEKFVALLVIIMAPIIAALFIIVWPAINIALAKVGDWLTYLPYGIDSFFYGIITRCLLPFEAHPAFYGPLWWTSAGGTLAGDNQINILIAMIYRNMNNGATVGIGQEMNYFNDTIMPFVNEHLKSIDGTTLADSLRTLIKNNPVANGFDGTKVYEGLISKGFDFGSASQAIQTDFKNYGSIDWTVSGDQLIAIQLLNQNPGFDMRDTWAINLKVTRYISGGFGNIMFVLPVIGFALWSTLDKERRKQKFGLYMGAILTSFTLGITEPVEFMMAFGAPIIFFGIYSPFFGIMYLFANLFQVKMGTTFSQGLLDFVINGLIPTFTRGGTGIKQTMFWVPLILGPIGAVIAFPLFRTVCIKLEFAAPGSLAAEKGIGISQSRFTTMKPQYDGVMEYLGKESNVKESHLLSKAEARFEVKRVDRVINNDYTINNLEDAYLKGQSFTIEAKNKQEGAVFLKLIDDYFAQVSKKKNFKALVKEEKFQNKEFIKSSKKSKKDISEDLKTRKKAIWRFKIEKERSEKINKIKAKWQFKQEQLMHTSDIDILKYNYKLELWDEKNYEKIAILKALYKYNLKLVKEKDIRKQIDTEYQQTLATLQPNKAQIQKHELEFKTKLKELKQAKKASYKKEHKK